MATFQLVIIPTSHVSSHPLHVGLTSKGRQKITGGQDDVKFIIVSLSQSDRYHQPPYLYTTSYLVNLNYISDLDIKLQDYQYHSCLFVTDFFLNHYNINREKSVVLQSVQPLPLQKVILTTSHEHTYDIIINSDFLSSLLEVLRSYRVLVRKNDVLLAPVIENDELSITTGGHHVYLNIKCLDCQPFVQGLLTPQTEIVIINATNTASSSVPSHGQDYLQVDTLNEAVNHQDDDGNTLMISQFLSNSPVKPIKTIKRITSDDPLKTNQLAVKLLLKPISKKRRSNLKLIPDDRCRIGITLDTLTSLSLFDCSWIKISVSRSSKTSFTKEGNDKIWRLVQLVAIENDNQHLSYTNGTVYVSPLLLFNLLPNPMDMTDINLLTAELQIPNNDELVAEDINKDLRYVSQSLCCQGYPPYAKSIHLSVVMSPMVTSSTAFVDILTRYFNQSRVIAQGDLICVKAEGRGLKDSESTQNLTVIEKDSTIFFKINKITGSRNSTCYYANTTYTSVYQETACHSYVPVIMDSFLGIPTCSYISGLERVYDQLQSVILPHLLPKLSTTSDMILPSILLNGPRSCGKTAVVYNVCKTLNIHLVDVNAYDCCGDTSSSTEARLQSAIRQGISCRPAVVLLRNIETLFKGPAGFADPRIIETLKEYLFGIPEFVADYPLVFIATSSNPKDIPAQVFGYFLHEVNVESPTEEERLRMLIELTSEITLKEDVDLTYIAKRTAGMVLGNLNRLLCHCKQMAHKRILNYCDADNKQNGNLRDLLKLDALLNVRKSYKVQVNVITAGSQLELSDFEQSLDFMQSIHSDAIGAPKIPGVTWEDVGGLANAKAEILDTIQLPLQHPELLAAGLRRSGLLFYGPPGTGKTLLAKAVATECSLNFLSVKGPELINMYVGQSEENVRAVFEKARNASPCVIFFDELDSLAPNRGKSGDSGGVMDRVVSQLLAELDGLNTAADVFAIGATNRPDLIDPALLRPGRFDKLVYLGVSEDHESQLKILQALTRKFNLHQEFSLQEFVKQCPFNLTGADFYALCSDAMFNAIKRRINDIEIGLSGDDEVVVTGMDFNNALTSITPSISVGELKRYRQIQNNYKYAK
ncbi:Peroxisome assembly factor 2 [Trichoplax sp. H2]|nr:Peroxisome assembly factor 2 [Trichoplax sp. H2]|eukprot:RDD44270.1 Peroxisome assembly factor 2 [Trichoplax sp. H2]